MGRRDETSAESRRRLLDAAQEVCAEVGVRQATVQSIAVRAGISRGSVGWHFGSKDQLIRAAIDDAFSWAADEIAAALARARKPSIEALLSAQLVLIGQPRGQLFATVLPEALTADDGLTAAYADGYERIRALYATYIRDHGLAPAGTPPGHLATALFGAAVGLNIQGRIDPERVDRPKALRALSRI
jgi:TetR/AcrR family acrAB operon transcriptional repressor